jgi:uncharacterized membrane protein YuzA (DUF378 family)
VVYGLVGLAAVYGVASLLDRRRRVENPRPTAASVTR